MSTWTSNLDSFSRRGDGAIQAGLIAAAEVLKNAVKKNLRGGYTSGDFATGRSMNSVTRSEPERGFGGFFIRVGTNLLYNLYWELGHRNVFLRQFVRVEKWRPALLDSREAQRAAFARVFTRVMESG